MRGKEINRIDVGIVRKHWDEGRTHPEPPHVPLGMVGRFKRTVGEKKVGVKAGPVFRRAKKKTDAVAIARAGDMNLLLHPVLLRIQARLPDLIGEDVNVEDEYSVSCSMKRGATAQLRQTTAGSSTSVQEGRILTCRCWNDTRMLGQAFPCW
jgi:hypothetical protein